MIRKLNSSEYRLHYIKLNQCHLNSFINLDQEKNKE